MSILGIDSTVTSLAATNIWVEKRATVSIRWIRVFCGACLCNRRRWFFSISRVDPLLLTCQVSFLFINPALVTTRSLCRARNFFFFAIATHKGKENSWNLGNCLATVEGGEIFRVLTMSAGTFQFNFYLNSDFRGSAPSSWRAIRT